MRMVHGHQFCGGGKLVPVGQYDCIIIATDHDAFDYELLLEHSQLIVDTRGRLLGHNNVVSA